MVDENEQIPRKHHMKIIFLGNKLDNSIKLHISIDFIAPKVFYLNEKETFRPCL